MKGTSVRRGLTCGLVSIVLLPVAIVVVLALGGLLRALGDAAAAAVCTGVALGLGVAFVVALVATSVASALAILDPPRPRRRRRRRGRRIRSDREPPRADRPLGLS